VCVYAIVPASMRGRGKWRGVQGELLKTVRCGHIAVVIGTVDAPPRPDRAHLERHDALMREIVSDLPAALPARFGLVERDLERVHALVEANGLSLREALRLVAGREQMTLRVTLADTRRRPRATPRSGSSPGPGRRYLTARLMRSQIPQDPTFRALRRRLAALVQKERFQLKDGGHTATLYHLIERGQSAGYLSKVRAFSERHPGVTLTASGPFPPYAFAPGLSD
jgi:hypothetical protein